MLAALNWSPLTLRPSKRSVTSYKMVDGLKHVGRSVDTTSPVGQDSTGCPTEPRMAGAYVRLVCTPCMEIRGERECTDCGERWSYYETGEIQCPACGSVRSVGVGGRAEHTDGPVELDLTGVRKTVDTATTAELAEQASEEAATYVRRAGFVHAGSLERFDDTYLAAVELRRVGAELARRMRVDDAAELYLLELLRTADSGDRPGPEAVPTGLHTPRGLAVAAAADAYASDIRRVHDDPGRAVSRVLSGVRAERKRIEALDGDVDPERAERVVRALRELYAYLGADDEAALARAQERL